MAARRRAIRAARGTKLGPGTRFAPVTEPAEPTVEIDDARGLLRLRRAVEPLARAPIRVR